MRKILIATIIIITLALAATVICLYVGNEPQEKQVTLSQFLHSRHNADIEAMVADMSMEEKVGQMFMGCFYSSFPSSQTTNSCNLGVILLFGKSFENQTPESVASAIKKVNESSKITPLFAVDEEGGDVNRISLNSAFRSSPFKSPRQLYAEGGMEAVIKDLHEKNALLSDLGIGLNLAPVCDISTTSSDFMYSRSLGQNADITSEYIAKTVDACNEDNIGCCLKHFPGYGNSHDTHKGLAVDDRSLRQIRNEDMKPFEAGIKAGAPSVMVSHNIVSSIDENLPASLSPRMHRILREDMDFKGVIITDDLSMGAITQHFSGSPGPVQAIMAGNDVLCTGEYKSQYRAVIDAVNDGVIPEERINQSVRRILQWKINLGLVRIPEK